MNCRLKNSSVRLVLVMFMASTLQVGTELRLQLLKNLYGLASKSGVFLVLHGASRLPKELIQNFIVLGVRKFNVNTEVRKAYMGCLKTPWTNLVGVIAVAKIATKVMVAKKLDLFGQ